jgi:hypothetical protein
VDEFRSQDFGPKAELGSTHGIGLGVSILSPEWNADKTRVDKVRYGLQSHACSAESICAGRSLEEAGSGHEGQHTNVGCLAGFV